MRTIFGFIRRCWGADNKLVDCVSGMSGTHEAYFTSSGSGKVQRGVRLSQPLLPTMRAIVQRVSSASVTGIYKPHYCRSAAPHGPLPLVASEKVSGIGQGLMVLIGIGAGASDSSDCAGTRLD